MSLPEAEEVADLLLTGGRTDVLYEDGSGHIDLIMCIQIWDCVVVLCCSVCEVTRQDEGQDDMAGDCFTRASWLPSWL